MKTHIFQRTDSPLYWIEVAESADAAEGSIPRRGFATLTAAVKASELAHCFDDVVDACAAINGSAA